MMTKRILLFLMLIGVIASPSALQAWEYPHQTLGDAFNAAQFDPSSPHASFFVVVADSHWGLGEEGIPASFISEVNAMAPHPAFFLLNGDAINSASVCFGHAPRSQQAREKAINEFRELKACLDRLNPDIAVKLTLGNHDTYPYEKDAGLFHQVFKESPIYSSFDLAGVHIVLLCGGQSGDLGETQTAWLKEDIDKIPATQTVILFVHQPPFSQVVRERGISESIRKVFATHEGAMWAICGHNHHNSTKVFKLPRTTVVQDIMISCNPKKVKKPGYWVYGLKDGQVQARIYREAGSGFRVAKPMDHSKPRPIPIPFGNTRNKLWTLFIGNGDREYLVKGKGADVEYWWAYIKDVVYKLPLGQKGRGATTLAMLADLGKANAEKVNQVLLSSNGEDWQVQALPAQQDGVYRFPIPESIQTAQDLYVKILGKNATCYLGGFTLCQ
jgi:Icc-related predicted phosphoesterase